MKFSLKERTIDNGLFTSSMNIAYDPEVNGFAPFSSDSKENAVQASVDINFNASAKVRESEADAKVNDEATFEGTVNGLEEAVIDSLNAGDLIILAESVTEVETDIILNNDTVRPYEVSVTFTADFEQERTYKIPLEKTCENPVKLDLADDSYEIPVGCDVAEQVDNLAETAKNTINEAIAESTIAEGKALLGKVTKLATTSTLIKEGKDGPTIVFNPSNFQKSRNRKLSEKQGKRINSLFDHYQ
ncbi:Oidioi.mRNA.OKI2018_I69.PAR.g11129.t1.cds [Oikopleura dioica]|uniref:Oidioi.mRNA.OKI2018_I69.PAR.g11129.t1.cds n=1 Tax=Oikopleura dioica TaxID=34765 RepID=A0ABN7RU97_OIKDI|nr:Oidioi.mRNA.OKI2018_I69.PAR.g11129.t1.cds [Oikopleura dioica]